VLGASFWFALPVESPPPLPADVAEDEADATDAPHDNHADSVSADLKSVDPKPYHE
jgi:two-component system, OmpR family, sensor histidine kinase KdpD